jgi:hypothetical protein
MWQPGRSSTSLSLPLSLSLRQTEATHDQQVKKHASGGCLAAPYHPAQPHLHSRHVHLLLLSPALQTARQDSAAATLHHCHRHGQPPLLLLLLLLRGCCRRLSRGHLVGGNQLGCGCCQAGLADSFWNCLGRCPSLLAPRQTATPILEWVQGHGDLRKWQDAMHWKLQHCCSSCCC